MTEKPTTGIGTKFQRWDPDNSSAADWTDVANVMGISGPGKSRETVDVTTLDSLDGYMEFIGGLRDPGTLSLELRFTHAGYLLLNGDYEVDEPRNYKIILPNASKTTLEMEALVTDLPLEISTDAPITCNVEFKITGKVNLSTGSST